MHLKVISRYSQLAKLQVEEVFKQLPDHQYKLTDIKTIGDKDKETPLIGNDVADFFTREIDEAILRGEFDISVHSAKDLPFPLADGLSIYALTEADDKSDALVSRGNKTLGTLPIGSKIGTSSEQRRIQLLALRPDLQLVSIRGTIEERLKAIDDGKIDALVVATCALNRLGLEQQITEILPFAAHALQGNLAIVGKSNNDEIENIFKPLDILQNYGKITTVGFGPGDEEYLTIKGLKALKKADVIYYDDLINKDFLDQFTCLKYYVGKRKDKHSKSQDEINELLYQSAIEGNATVRLKGGDPSVFGRLGEELQYLRERLIEVEVIPGITTASAAAALSGISLTQRGLSKSVAFVSGYKLESEDIPNAQTLVFYMAATSFKSISRLLIKKGWDKSTQVAIISNVSFPNQKTTIYELSDLTKEQSIHTPAIIIVSKVINKQIINSYINQKPKVLVTGTKKDNYHHLGKVVHTPLISIKPLPPDYSFYERLTSYDYIVFTSTYTVNLFFKYLIESGKDVRQLNNHKIISIGNNTGNSLKEHGVIADYQPIDESSDGIVNYFKQSKITAQSILIPRSNLGLNTIPDGISQLGNKVDIYKIYKNEIPNNVKKVDLNDFKYIVFSSPSCIDNFKTIYGKLPQHIQPITIGKVTKKHLTNTLKIA